jgi:hypothetical protein
VHRRLEHRRVHVLSITQQVVNVTLHRAAPHGVLLWAMGGGGVVWGGG